MVGLKSEINGKQVNYWESLDREELSQWPIKGGQKRKYKCRISLSWIVCPRQPEWVMGFTPIYSAKKLFYS